MDPENIEKKHPHVLHPKELLNKELKGISKFNY